MIIGTEIISLEELYDIFIRDYLAGNYTEGICRWTGDDALMGPRSFAHKFKKKAEGMGYSFEQYQGYADELEEWCSEHLAHLENKFR